MTVSRSTLSPSRPTTPPTTSLRAPDWALAASVAALTVFGLVMIYSTTYPWRDEAPMYFMLRQAVYAAAGIVALLVMMRIPYRAWQRHSVLLILATLGTLALLLVIGRASFGAARWFLNGSIQPTEIAKLLVIIYVADWLSSKGQQIRHFSLGLVPFSIFIGIVTGLILLQPNMSMAMLIAMTAFCLFLVAGADLLQIFVGTTLGALAAIALILLEPYRMRRVAMFIDPLSDPDGLGYHITRALAALNNGGVTGIGLGNTLHKYNNMLPAPHTDSIFALIGEELGFLGALGVIVLFAIVAWRGLRIAYYAPDRFGTLLAAGVTILVVLQAMINVAVMTATVPFTGLPLPFISYGGSSLVSSMAAIGLLLNISRYQRSDISAEPVRITRKPRGPRPALTENMDAPALDGRRDGGSRLPGVVRRG